MGCITNTLRGKIDSGDLKPAEVEAVKALLDAYDKKTGEKGKDDGGTVAKTAENEVMKETEPKKVVDNGKDYTYLIKQLEGRVVNYINLVTTDKNNINTMRKLDDGTYGIFGNPFSKWTVSTEADGELSAMYYDWVVNNRIPASYLQDADNKDKRLQGTDLARKKIIGELKNIAGKKLYYNGTARGKELSHASTLALIADLYNQGKLTIDLNKKQEILKPRTVEKQETKLNSINIYSGEKNGYESLSNFNAGPVKINGKEFKTVEHAFQYWKASALSSDENKASNQKKVLATASGFEAQKAGRGMMLDVNKLKEWNEGKSTAVLKKIMKDYYNQNKEARELLLSTGRAILTHQKNGKNIDNRTADILMSIREELRQEGDGYAAGGDIYTQSDFDVTVEELDAIDKANNEFLNNNPDIVVKEGDKFYYEKGVITLDNNANRADRVVYLGHEIVHAKTEEWLKDVKNSAMVKRLEKAITVVIDKLEALDVNKMTDGQLMLWNRLAHDNGRGIEARTIENVAVLAAEPAVRKELMKFLPEQDRSIISKILDKVKEWLGKELPMDAKRILELVDSMVDKAEKEGKDVRYQSNTKPNVTNKFDAKLNEKIKKVLKKLYPEIKLEYTDEIQYVDADGNIMNQEEVSNVVKYTLKIAAVLDDWATTKPAKYGGESQPVLETIRLKQEAGIRKRLAGKGVNKEQIDFMFEFMRQNDIGEIKTKELAEKLLLGLAQNVDISTSTNTMSEAEFDKKFEEIEYLREVDSTIPQEWFDSELDKLYEQSRKIKNTDYYSKLSVPGGINYREVEISTPNIKVDLKGHADFATDEGIGWYRVDDAVLSTEANTEGDVEGLPAFFGDNFEDNSKTLRVLEMQSDMFQRMKDVDLTKSDKSKDLDKAFHQILNTDGKWVKFFIKSIVQNAQRNGYTHIRFPGGETAAKIEGHDTAAAILDKKRKKLDNINKDLIKKTDELEIAEKNNNTYKIALLTKTLTELKDTQKELMQELKDSSLEKIAPIEAFYQIRIKNALMKEYGRDNIKTVTDEHENIWFELKLDSKRDSNVIMLQRQGTDHVTLIKGEETRFEGTAINIINTKGDVVGSMKVDYDSTLERELGRADLDHLVEDFSKSVLGAPVVMLNDLYIEKEFRGNSYGINAVDQLIAEVGGDKDILLDSYPTDGTIEQGDLNAFYESLGFEVIEEAKKEGIYLMRLNKDKFNIAKQKNMKGKIKGQADIKAGTVLINSLLQSQDTLPHEYAHHYIAWFRSATIVQEAIKKWGSEEALVQAIGEQVVEQKGEAYSWWKKFTRWVQKIFDNSDKATKEELKDTLTDAFLTRTNLNKYQDGIRSTISKASAKQESDIIGIKDRKSQLDNDLKIMEEGCR